MFPSRYFPKTYYNDSYWQRATHIIVGGLREIIKGNSYITRMVEFASRIN